MNLSTLHYSKEKELSQAASNSLPSSKVPLLFMFYYLKMKGKNISNERSSYKKKIMDFILGLKSQTLINYLVQSPLLKELSSSFPSEVLEVQQLV